MVDTGNPSEFSPSTTVPTLWELLDKPSILRFASLHARVLLYYEDRLRDLEHGLQESNNMANGFPRMPDQRLTSTDRARWKVLETIRAKLAEYSKSKMVR